MLKYVTKRKRNSKIIDCPFPVCLHCKRMILLKCINIIPETKLMIEYECSCGKKFNLPFKSYNTVLQIFQISILTLQKIILIHVSIVSHAQNFSMKNMVLRR